MARHTTTARPFPYEPDYAVPPGETLLETIEAQGIDQKELAQRTGFTEKHISQVVQGKAPISADAAIRLERVTGVPARLWNNLEAQYRERLARLDAKSKLEADLDWLGQIPVKELVNRGAIPAAGDRVSLLESVLRFFGVASVEAWRTGWGRKEFAFRRPAAHPVRDGALATWLRLGEIEAAARECQPYRAKRFRANLERIRGLTTDDPPKFIPRMVRWCAEAGVALALVPEIKGAPVNGAAKWLTRSKAMVCLSLWGKYSDRFWFTFFHEAGHILNDSKQEVFVDVDRPGDLCEKEANAFACRMLIPARFESELPTLRTHAAVVQFAEKIGIHPGIVVGRLQWQRYIPFSHLNGLKVQYHWTPNA